MPVAYNNPVRCVLCDGSESVVDSEGVVVVYEIAKVGVCVVEKGDGRGANVM